MSPNLAARAWHARDVRAWSLNCRANLNLISGSGRERLEIPVIADP